MTFLRSIVASAAVAFAVLGGSGSAQAQVQTETGVWEAATNTYVVRRPCPNDWTGYCRTSPRQFAEDRGSVVKRFHMCEREITFLGFSESQDGTISVDTLRGQPRVNQNVLMFDQLFAQHGSRATCARTPVVAPAPVAPAPQAARPANGGRNGSGRANAEAEVTVNTDVIRDAARQGARQGTLEAQRELEARQARQRQLDAMTPEQRAAFLANEREQARQAAEQRREFCAQNPDRCRAAPAQPAVRAHARGTAEGN